MYFYESRYIRDLIDSGKIVEASKLKDTFRYLDDLLSINDEGYFQTCISLIYPVELKLSATNADARCSEFLDLDISIINGKIDTKVFDKRRNFPFKSINFPDIKFSNIPERPSYGVYFSQLIRIVRICNKLEYFVNEMILLTNAFLVKGFSKV